MKILVAVEDPSLSESLSMALDSLPTHNRVFVQTTQEAIKTVCQLPIEDGRPDLIILDYQLPDLSGMKGVSQLSTRLGRPNMALLLHGGSLELAHRAQQAGANAILSRNLPSEDFAHGLQMAANGKFLTLFSRLFHISQAASLSHLSEREVQVLRGLCDGLQNKEIAHSFSIQEVTVKMHMRAVVRKLGAKNRTHAAMIARDMNLI